jgi:NADPH:quinone reductase-like Zn-dependent oxidoreductase
VNAIVLTETGAPGVLRLGTAPDPTAGPGEVVVSLRAAAVNRRDIYLR